jgi:hypothetical protein
MQPVESNAGPLVRLSPSRRRVPVVNATARPLGVLASGNENLSPRANSVSASCSSRIVSRGFSTRSKERVCSSDSARERIGVVSSPCSLHYASNGMARPRSAV